jgi:hypothetical protein
MQKLGRDEFFGHPAIQKLASQINKKTLEGFSFMYIKDKKVVKLLKDNENWLDYIGIIIEWRQKKKHLFIKWTAE